MSVQYNMDPFDVLKIIYQGETDGFVDEDFDKNERERGITVPKLLKKFLKTYGYMSVNRLSDSVRILHPNIMSERIFSYGGDRELPLTIIGRLGEFQVAFSDRERDDPEIFLLKTDPSGAQILPSDDTISELFKVMTCGVLLRTSGVVIADDPQLAVKLLRENSVDLDRITCNPKLRREYSICFSEEMRTFVAAEFIEGEYARFFFARSENFLIVNE